MKTAFGLDIAGYSTGKSGFARADINSNKLIEVMVYKEQGQIFARKIKGENLIKDIVQMEKEVLLACCKRGPIFVDIPIDLSGLLPPANVSFIWELTQRPVDFAFGAMPPLADRIGSPVARFLNMYLHIQKEFKDPLGKQIFETYPSRSLFCMGLRHKKYKKQEICFSKMNWRPNETNKGLFEIVNGLKLSADEGVCLNDDELDAVICAITGVVDEEYCLQGNELANEINRLISNDKQYSAPVGYVILKKKPEFKIHITTKIVKNQKELLKEVAR